MCTFQVQCPPISQLERLKEEFQRLLSTDFTVCNSIICYNTLSRNLFISSPRLLEIQWGMKSRTESSNVPQAHENIHVMVNSALENLSYSNLIQSSSYYFCSFKLPMSFSICYRRTIRGRR